MKKILLFITAVTIGFSMHAQKQTNNWTFGISAGLSWNSTRSMSATGISGTAASPTTTLAGLPIAFTSGISQNEGCFTLSDADGNILFYSNGITIWDKTNAVMSNGTGLTGGISSAQSGIIIPYPGAANQYAAITIGADVANNLSYSVVDMTLNSGLGAVVAGKKNIPFTGASATLGESVTTIQIPNTSDYWVIAPSRGANTSMNAWRFSSSGIPATPVVSSFPGLATSTSSNGYLKLTPDGAHFVWATYFGDAVFAGDFNVNTGAVTNMRKVKMSFSSPYGVEFSPDYSLVYIRSQSALNVFKVSEFFSLPDPAQATKKTYANPSDTESTLQLAPDGRIYLVRYGTSDMYVIDNPNEFANMKMYLVSSILAPNKGNMGLPSFAANWFVMKPTAKKFACTGYDYKFTTKVDMSGGANAPVKLNLDYGDTTTGTITLVSGQTSYDIAHTYQTAGTYTVTLTPVKGDNSTLTPTTVSAEVVDCTIRTNRMIRVDLQNTNTATGQ